MERLVTYDLRRYKLVFSKNKNSEKGAVTGNNLDNILLQDPIRGWSEVINPEIAFKIADINHVKLSKKYLKRIKPSEEFFERRRNSDDSNNKKKR